MYPGPEILMEVGRIAIAGARLDVEMGELWHHLDRAVAYEDARSEFGSKQRREVDRLANERLVGKLREQVLAVVQDAFRASSGTGSFTRAGCCEALTRAGHGLTGSR